MTPAVPRADTNCCGELCSVLSQEDLIPSGKKLLEAIFCPVGLFALPADCI